MTTPNASILELASADGAYEPQRQFQWLFTIQGLEGQAVLELALRSANIPNPTVEEIEIPYMNGNVYAPGRIIFSEETITFNDYLDKDVAGIIEAWHRQVANAETQKIGLSSEIKKEGTLTLFGPDFSTERIWLLKGIWPRDVNYGDLDMSSSDVVQIEVTFRYDRAQYGENSGADRGVF
jgi:hypothetical protein